MSINFTRESSAHLRHGMDISVEMIVFACIVAIICVYLYLLAMRVYAGQTEDFTTNEEKATQLSQWVTENPSSPYTNFIQANPESNIVEYTKLKELLSNGKFISGSNRERIVTASKALRL